MKNLILTILIIVVSISASFCQQVEIKKSLGGYKYSQDGTPIKLKKLVKLLESNNEAYALIKKAKSNHNASNVFGFSGGFLLGAALGSGQSNSRFLAAGGGLIVLGIILSSNSKNKAKQAIDIYNSSIESSSYLSPAIRFQITSNSNGLGIAIIF